MFQLIIILVGSLLMTYLSYQTLMKEAHILVKLIAPVVVFAVSFVVIFIALLIVGVIPFQR